MICQDGKDRDFKISDETLTKFFNQICDIGDIRDDVPGLSEGIKTVIYDIYEQGLNNGQEFVWKVRAGDFEGANITQDLKTFTIVTSGDTIHKNYEYVDGKLIEKET